jgi:uncharacterized membrane protein (Fun14 family)
VDKSDSTVAKKVGTGAIGTLVAGYALFDVVPIAVRARSVGNR